MSRTALSFSLALIAACGPDVRIDDDLRNESNLSLFNLGVNHVHSPYSLGTSFTFEVWSTRDADELEIVSSDPSVLAVGPLRQYPDPELDNVRVASAQTLSAGEATIEVRRIGGRVLESQLVRVAAPDRVELVPVPLAIAAVSEGAVADEPEDLADARPSVVQWGRVDLVLAPYAGDELLSGAQDPELLGDGTSQVVVSPGAFASNRLYDVVLLEGRAAGTGAVTIRLASGDFELPYEVVADEDVVRLGILGNEEAESAGAEGLRALVGYTEADDPVYGVAADWSFDGAAVPPPGDVLAFTVEDGPLVEARAVAGAREAAVQVRGADPRVLDATEVTTCSYAGSATPIAALAASLVVFARRRRFNR